MTQSWGPPKIVLDALDGVPAFDETATLRECTRMVGRALGATVTVPDSARRRTYLSSLLMAVLEYADGLQVLGGVVELLEGNTRYTERVRTAIAVAEVPLFPPEDWSRLMEALGGLEVLDIAGAYQEVMRYHADPLPAHCTEPWLAVVHAATLNARPGELPPCVLLVEHLARYAKGQQQQDLLGWAMEHRARPESYGEGPALPAKGTYRSERGRPARPEDITAVPAAPVNSGESALPVAAGAESGLLGRGVRTAAPAPAPPVRAVGQEPVWAPSACLLIRLRPLPDPDHEGERLLSYWWQIEGPEPYPVRGGDLRVDVAELPEQVKSLVEEAETGWAYFCKEDLTLEFVLPRELLGLPVEQWAKRGFHGADGSLGEDHPVLLRSLERMERTDTHGRWARRWDALLTGCAGPVHWFPDDGRSRLLSDPRRVMVVLSDPPGGTGGRGSGVDELAESLRAGVPIVVWDRRGGIDPVFRGELADLAARTGIHQLPDAVRSLRIEAKAGDAAEGDSTLGRHAALLWDDPYRLPGGGGAMADSSAQGGG
ncbi:effector-associated domain 2-containing protein [Streptomyces sp. NRRL B-1347]|uniref:VMAP-C domain-containing protein n=1 Tax=Streptomyces sp. NRRL B-1347 TaxID=1476877 RepID=UPI000B31943B|nr:hypothetical protein [Streptomyces sp. NRRL B-1347]